MLGRGGCLSTHFPFADDMPRGKWDGTVPPTTRRPGARLDEPLAFLYR